MEQYEKQEVGTNIVIAKNRKWQNPAKLGRYPYAGDITTFTFKMGNYHHKQQQNKYEQIQESLQPFGLALSHIWAGKSNSGLNLVAKTPNGEVYWRKIQKRGTGGNFIHAGKKLTKIHTATWLRYTEAERYEYLKDTL